MKKVINSVFILFLSASTLARAEEFDAKTFASNYFNGWVATQSPLATKSDIKKYLHFLKNNVGHQHLPYDPTVNRAEDNKKSMLKGMLYYLRSHSEYTANLVNTVAGYNVVVIKYHTRSKGKHPQTGEILELSYDTVEVLEIEDGKVAVIRKYSE